MSELKFDITGDNTQFLAALKQAQQGISATIDQLSKSGGKVDESMSEAAHKMGSSVQKASTDAKQGVSQLEQEYARLTSAGSKATTQAGDLKDKIAEQKAVIQQVKADVRDLQKAYENAAPGKAQNEAYAEFKAAQKVLEEEKVILASLEDEQKKYEASTKSLKAQLREMTERMAQMRIEGKANTEEYKELEKESAKLADAMADVNRAKKNLASDTGTFDAMVSGANLAAGAVSAYAGAMEMFGVNTEDAEEAQRGLQAAMAISTGLQNVQNQLQKESAVMLGLTNIQRRASVIATNLETAAQGKNIVVTKLATIAQAAFNAVAKANPYILLTTALISVVGALALFVKGKKDAARAEKEHQAQMAQSKKLLQEQAQRQKAIAGAAANATAKFIQLQTEWKNLKTIAEKTDFIKKKQSEFDSLGITITKISTAEKVFASQTNQFAAAMAARAIAAAKAAQAVEDYMNFITNKPKTERKYGNVKAGDSYSKLSQEEKTSLTQKGFTGTGGKLSEEAATYIQSQRHERAKAAMQRQYNDNLKKEKELRDKVVKATEEELKANNALSAMGDKKTGNAGKDSAAEKAKEQQAYNDELRKQTAERSRREKEAELNIAQYRIDALAEGSKKEIQQIELNLQKELSAIEKEKEAIIAAREQEARAIWEKANPNAGEKGQNWDNTGKVGKTFELTDTEKQMYEAREKAAQASYSRQIADRLRADAQYAIDYLKEFGTMQEQRYAIEKEYDDKIEQLRKNGASKYEIRIAEREKAKTLSSYNAQSLAQGIDWSSVMTGVGTMVQSIADATLKKIDEYMKTDEYKNLSFADKESIYKLRSQVSKRASNDTRSPFGNAIWKQLAQDTKAYESSLLRAKKANDEHEKALEDLKKAEKDYAKAIASGDIAKINLAAVRKAKAETRVDESGKEVQDAQAQQTQSQQNLVNTTNELDESMNNFMASIQNLTSGSLYGFANGIAGIIQSFTGVDDEAKKTGNALSSMKGKVGSWIGAILQIIDILGDKPTEFIEDLFKKISKAVEAIIRELPEILGSVIDGVGDIIGGALQGITSWFGLDSESERIHRSIEDLIKANKGLQQSTDNLTDVMDKESTQDRLKDYQLIMQNTEQKMINAQRGMYKAGDNSSTWSGSSNHKINQAMIDDKDIEIAKMRGIDTTGVESDWARVSKVVGRTIKSAGDFWTLTSKEMWMVATYESDIYQKIKDHADDGKENAAQFMDEYINYWIELQEQEERYAEYLTGINFDTLKNEFVSVIMDMDASIDDFADNIKTKITKGMLDMIFGLEGGVNDQLLKLQTELADEMKKVKGDATKLDKTWFKGWNERMQDLYNYAYDQAQGIYSITGYGDILNQKATANDIQSITADQADQLIGRITAMQIAVETSRGVQAEMAERITTGINYLMSINVVGTQANETLNAILLQHVQSNSYLEDMTKYSKGMYNEWGEKLNKITQQLERL